MWKSLSLCFLLLVMCSCALPGKFEANLDYDEQGRQTWHVITTKNYGLIDADIKTNKDGTMSAKVVAEKVDATTLAAKTIEAQTSIINSLAGIVGVVR